MQYRNVRNRKVRRVLEGTNVRSDLPRDLIARAQLERRIEQIHKRKIGPIKGGYNHVKVLRNSLRAPGSDRTRILIPRWGRRKQLVHTLERAQN
jgi:hypothetical protein